jgi:hypothetical protein
LVLLFNADRRTPVVSSARAEYSRPFSFEERRRGGHLDPFGQRADRHDEIHARPATDLHLDVFHERHGEIHLLGGDHVDAGPHRDELEGAVRAALALDVHPRVGVQQGDGSLGNHGAGRVAHGAHDRAGFELAARWRCRQKTEQRAEQYRPGCRSWHGTPR